MATKEKSVLLYDVKNTMGDWYLLRAIYNQETGMLTIQSRDFSQQIEDLFGDEEYETIYYLDKENVDKLKALLKCDNILKGLEDFFQERMILHRFIKLCEENHIEFLDVVR